MEDVLNWTPVKKKRVKLFMITLGIHKTCITESVQLNEFGAVPIFGVILQNSCYGPKNRMHLN
jgi:hypothetical protein